MGAGSSWPGLSLPVTSPYLPSSWGRGLPTTDTHICTAGLRALAGIPQGSLDTAAAVRGQEPCPPGVQELLHVGQQCLAGREEASAEPQQLPASLLAVPVATEPSAWTLRDQLPGAHGPAARCQEGLHTQALAEVLLWHQAGLRPLAMTTPGSLQGRPGASPAVAALSAWPP